MIFRFTVNYKQVRYYDLVFSLVLRISTLFPFGITFLKWCIFHDQIFPDRHSCNIHMHGKNKEIVMFMQ